MRIVVGLALPALLLAACSGKEETSNSSGFTGTYSLPGVLIAHGDIDVDGVKMFPGSHLGNVTVSNNDALIGFTSPESLAAVKAYYIKQFAEKAVTVTANGDGFSGKTKDGDDFSLSFFTKNGATTATMLIHDNKK
jgi:hypothetical protein